MSEVIWGCLPDNLKQNKPYRKIRWNDSPYFIEKVSEAIKAAR
jgi:LysR family hydrogen peroxide-inducible transcriptional activator